MTDCFSLLEQPRSAALDEAALREKFHRRVAVLHPDAAAGDAAAFAELNAAFTILSDPARRLRHLLELDHPEVLAQPAAIPPEMADLFPVVAQARAAILALVPKRAGATSAVARALLAPEEKAARELAQIALEKMDALRASATAELPGAEANLDCLSELHQRFSFLGKWARQLREALLELEIG